MSKEINIEPANEKLGVLVAGLGAVSTTFMAGVEAMRKGMLPPIGALSQRGTVRLGKRTDGHSPLIKDLVPLAGLDQIVFGGWDIFPDNGYESANNAQVLTPAHLEGCREGLEPVVPMKGVWDPAFLPRLEATHYKEGGRRMDKAEALRQDIRDFIKSSGVGRAVVVWCGSTERFIAPQAIHGSLERLETALKDDDPQIPPSMIYAYAALKEGVPYINGAPNFSVDSLALVDLANQARVPIAGKDFKTGQTLMKTILAPGIKARLLGLAGWYSTNILGNRDGEVLDDPGAFKSKETTKLGVLDTILQPELYPELYGDYSHKVRIDYYPPRGDNKEGWDNIDIIGWMGYPMSIKINFLCRDSILAAPVVLDLVLFMDLAARAGFYGIQEWLSFYFKSPMVREGLYPEHDLFIQQMKLKNTLRHLAGETLITHLGLDYYYDDMG